MLQSTKTLFHLDRWMHPHPKVKIKEIGLMWWEAHPTLNKVRGIVHLTVNHLAQVGNWGKRSYFMSSEQ